MNTSKKNIFLFFRVRRNLVKLVKLVKDLFSNSCSSLFFFSSSVSRWILKITLGLCSFLLSSSLIVALPSLALYSFLNCSKNFLLLAIYNFLDLQNSRNFLYRSSFISYTVGSDGTSQFSS